MKQFSRIGYVVKLGRYIEGMWGHLLLSIVFNLLFKITPLAISFVTSYMISTAVLGNVSNIWRLFFAALILVLLSGVFAYMDVLVSHDTAYRILAKLRNIAYDKIDELAPAAMEGRHSGELTSIVLEDVETLEWFYAHTIGQLAVAVIVPLTALILLGFISPLISLILVPFIVLMICVPIRTAKKADTQGVSVKAAYSELNTQIVDGVQGLKDIISFGWQGQYFSRFSSALKKHEDAQLNYAKRSGNETRNFQLVIGIGSLCGQAVAAALVMNGNIGAVWLIPVFILCSAIFTPIQDALTMSTNYGLIFGASKRLFDLLQMKPTVVDSGCMEEKDLTEQKNDNAHTISFEHVAFTYPSDAGKEPNKQLFKDLNFYVDTDETVALVGASGSGKTTVARLLQRVWDVDQGKITINGADIRELKLETLRDIITVVPQEVYLFNLSVQENIRMAKLDATPEEIRSAAEDAQASGFIERLPQGYETILGERGLRLSGGEKQRLSIAQAFLKNSPVLVLDEASANLDSETERQINRAIGQLKQGRATLVIAHRVSTIRQADRVIVLRNGNVVGVGTYEDLMKNCEYFNQLLGGEDYAEGN